jgi:hypothetical protein
VTQVEEVRLSLLDQPFQVICRRIIAGMLRRGHREPFIGDTVRTTTEQQEAVRRGTTSRKQKLTWHFRFRDGGRAIDFRHRLENGSRDATTNNEPFFMDLFLESRAAGVRCLGYDMVNGHPVKKYINGGKLWDPGHVEYRTPYKTLVEACRTEIPFVLGEDAPDDDPDDVIPDPLPLGELPPSPFK